MRKIKSVAGLIQFLRRIPSDTPIQVRKERVYHMHSGGKIDHLEGVQAYIVLRK